MDDQQAGMVTTGLKTAMLLAAITAIAVTPSALRAGLAPGLASPGAAADCEALRRPPEISTALGEPAVADGDDPGSLKWMVHEHQRLYAGAGGIGTAAMRVRYGDPESVADATPQPR